MYNITTFIADDTPTRYEKPLGGGAPLAAGKETVVKYETYDDCLTQLEAYSQAFAAVKSTVWTAHKMYREAKLPSLLHYIDNNYPGITMSSKAEKI